jgi:hypothetical protein
LDATHFRQRAAHAREMAQSGDDMRLSRMLLEVALDLDAEADAMEAGRGSERRNFPRARPSDIQEGLLHLPHSDAEARPVEIINLSVGGAKFRGARMQAPGSKVVLELPDHGLRLDGTILRTRGAEAAMVFDPDTSADPALRSLVRSQTRADPVRA